MARLARLSVAGYPHHIIQRGNNRQPIFLDDTDYAHMLHLLRDAAVRHHVALHAWVLLPGELQLLATPEQADGLPHMMQDVGRSYVRGFNNRHLRSGTLWEGRYRCTVLDADPWLLKAMVCLDLLPVQQGLVAHPHDYPWSSSAAYTGHYSLQGVTMPPQVWQLGNTPFARESAYQSLLKAPDALASMASLQEHALHGWVQGSAEFVRHLQQLTGRRLQKKAPGRPLKA